MAWVKEQGLMLEKKKKEIQSRLNTAHVPLAENSNSVAKDAHAMMLHYFKMPDYYGNELNEQKIDTLPYISDKDFHGAQKYLKEMKDKLHEVEMHEKQVKPGKAKKTRGFQK